jgi:SAM-dependent methyltransferase
MNNHHNCLFKRIRRRLKQQPEYRHIPAVWGNLYRGLSLARAFLRYKLSTISADGTILDVGSGGSDNTRFMSIGANAKILAADIRPLDGVTIVCDLEKEIPLEQESVDALLLLNVLEHIYNYENLIAECCRVLKPGGVMYLYVPYLYQHHIARYADFTVDDYFRFSPGAIKKLLTGTGRCTEIVEVDTCGYGPFTAASNYIATVVSAGWFKVVIHMIGFIFDKIYYLVKGNAPDRVSIYEWPIAVWVKAVK